MIKNILTVIAMMLSLSACAANTEKAAEGDAASAQETNQTTKTENTDDMTPVTPGEDVLVEINTTMGPIVVKLYGDTPKHQANFLKLVKEGYYDNVLFHRVINEFMIQTGDPDSKTAQPGQMLGQGGPGYQIDAEIVYPKHYHKRGALAAARTGDQVNPLRKSSGSQFYIVTGRKMSEAEVGQLDQMLENSQMQAEFNKLVEKNMPQIRAMQQSGNYQGLQVLQDQLIREAEAAVKANPMKATDEMKKDYATVGGAPHLDNQYTVFGEVVSGMDVVDKIEKAQTDGNDRPVQDIKILSTKVIEE